MARTAYYQRLSEQYARTCSDGTRTTEAVETTAAVESTADSTQSSTAIDFAAALRARWNEMMKNRRDCAARHPVSDGVEKQ